MPYSFNLVATLLALPILSPLSTDAMSWIDTQANAESQSLGIDSSHLSAAVPRQGGTIAGDDKHIVADSGMFSSVLVLDSARHKRGALHSTNCVAITADTIVTTYHGLAPSTSAWVNLGENGIAQVVSVVFSDQLADIVVAKVDRPTLAPCSQISWHTTPRRRSAVQVLSRYSNGKLIVTDNQFIRLASGYLAPQLVLSGRLPPNSSGSPIFDDTNQLVGLVIASANASDDKARAVPINIALSALNDERSIPSVPFAQWLKAQGGNDPAEYWTTWAEGLSLEQAGKLAEAEAKYELALQKNPNGWSAIFGLYSMMMQRGKSFEARKAAMLQATEQSTQKHLVSWILLSDQALQGKYDKAGLNDVSQMLETPEVEYWLAVAEYMAGDTKPALKRLENARNKWRWYSPLNEGIVTIASRDSMRDVERQARNALWIGSPSDEDYAKDFIFMQQEAGDDQGVKESLAQLRTRAPFAANRIAQLLKDKTKLPQSSER